MLELLGGSSHLATMVIVSPLTGGCSFQMPSMAYKWAFLTTKWGDPPSRIPVANEGLVREHVSSWVGVRSYVR